MYGYSEDFEGWSDRLVRYATPSGGDLNRLARRDRGEGGWACALLVSSKHNMTSMRMDRSHLAGRICSWDLKIHGGERGCIWISDRTRTTRDESPQYIVRPKHRHLRDQDKDKGKGWDMCNDDNTVDDLLKKRTASRSHTHGKRAARHLWMLHDCIAD